MLGSAFKTFGKETGSALVLIGFAFDIGDTLLPATALQHNTLLQTAAALERERIIPDATAFARAYQSADQHPHLDALPDLNHLYADVRIVRAAFEALGWEVRPELATGFLEAYRKRLRSQIRPDSSLVRALLALRDSGRRLAIVSNGTTVEQFEQLSLMGIRELFDPIIISQEIGIRKPDPRCFHLVSDSWGVPPFEVMVVGDRPDWEVVGGKQAGMRTALTTQFVDHRNAIGPDSVPDYVIRHVAELESIE